MKNSLHVGTSLNSMISFFVRNLQTLIYSSVFTCLSCDEFVLYFIYLNLQFNLIYNLLKYILIIINNGILWVTIFKLLQLHLLTGKDTMDHLLQMVLTFKEVWKHQHHSLWLSAWTTDRKFNDARQILLRSLQCFLIFFKHWIRTAWFPDKQIMEIGFV